MWHYRLDHLHANTVKQLAYSLATGIDPEAIDI